MVKVEKHREETSLIDVPEKEPEPDKAKTMPRHVGDRVWVWRLWCVGALQEVVEAWVRAWLVQKFRSPVMCRVSVKDDRWCMVPSLTQNTMRRVPAWRCVYDPWCGALVFSETAPPIFTRLFVLLGALMISLLVVWAPRILTYRPSNTILIWIKRQTPRLVLVLVAGSAMLQLMLDHLFLPLVLPSSLLLTHTLSLATFCCTMLLMTVVLAIRVIQQESQPYHTQQLRQRRTDDESQWQDREMKDWENHSNTYGAYYAVPDDYHHLVTDNLL